MVPAPDGPGGSDDSRSEPPAGAFEDTDDGFNRLLLGASVAVAVLALLYSVLILGQPLAWVGLVVPFAILYLSWRFVRAVERIADAQVQRARLERE